MKKEIPVLYTSTSFEHNPPFEVFNGKPDTAQENVRRVKSIMNALLKNNFTNVQLAKDESLTFVKLIHDPKYLDYLNRASKSTGAGSATYPSVHPYVPNAKTNNLIGERGLYVFDTYTPIMDNTFEVAVNSATCAVTGARMLLEGQELVYALTRPPGHHAEKSMAGGYCYINNAAVAAEFLLKNSAKKVAIFDFDFHHGNGTQDIFYERPDVIVVNINAMPENKFPYFTGNQEELGKGRGVGTNFNFPLPPLVKDDEYHKSVQKSLDLISKFSPDYLVVSAGFDTHESDPICDFKLTTEYYRKLGRSIKSLGIPTLSVQEGGYATEVLGENVVSYLSGLLEK
jgi:acetoin utilization deacetylase AcuC-like enzyme